MKRYEKQFILHVRKLRSEGRTYGEIKRAVGMKVPKATLNSWCKDIVLTDQQRQRIENINSNNLDLALAVLKQKRKKFLHDLEIKNLPFADKVFEPVVAKTALAMLCLGEATKYKTVSCRPRYFYSGVILAASNWFNKAIFPQNTS